MHRQESRQNASFRILVDTLPVSPRRSSAGARRYVLEVLKSLNAAHDVRVDLVCSRSNVQLFESLDRFERTVIPWSTESRVVRVLTQQALLPLIAIMRRPNVVFETVDHAAVLTPCPVVTTLLSNHVNAAAGSMTGVKLWFNKIALRLTVRRSRRIVAISNFVKETCVSLLGADVNRITVIYLGGGVVERALEAGWRRPEDHERTGGIVFVSTLYPHKNVDKLIKAYALLKKRCAKTPGLTIVGGDSGGERMKLEALAAALQVERDTHFLGDIPDAKLLELFRECRLMVYPSSLEGFGLPAVEAMQAGIPLIASNRSCIPEVVDGAAILIDPDDVNALASAMGSVLNEPDVRQRLISSGIKRGKDFSWAKTGAALLQVLKEAGGESS